MPQTRFLLAAILLLAGAATAEAAGEHQRFLEHFHAVELDEALLVLDAWKAAEGMNSPQIYIDYANVWFAKARQPRVEITQDGSPPGPGEWTLPLTEEGSPNATWTLRESPQLDSESARKAEAFLRQALAKYPLRLDIHFGLATILERHGETDSMLRALEEACLQSKRTADAMLWLLDQPLKQAMGESAGTFVPRTLQEFTRRFLLIESAASDVTAEAVAKLAIKHYPEHPHAYNSIGVLHTFKGDWKPAIGSFERALALDPSDAMVMINIARCRHALGDLAAALGELGRARAATQDPGLHGQIDALAKSMKEGP